MSALRTASLSVSIGLVFTLAGGCFLGGPDTLLGHASGTGDLAAMTALLNRGADPNAPGSYGLTPLAFAARNGRVAAIELLLSRGADPHRGCGVNGWTPLLHALHKDQLAAAERLIATCVAPSAELDDALFMAAGYAQTEAVSALLARGADPARNFGNGANALSNAVSGAFDIDFRFRGCDTHNETVRALLSFRGLVLHGSVDAARRTAKRRGCTGMLAALDERQAARLTAR